MLEQGNPAVFTQGVSYSDVYFTLIIEHYFFINFFLISFELMMVCFVSCADNNGDAASETNFGWYRGEARGYYKIRKFY